MSRIRITDFGGKTTEVTVHETPEELNGRIDNAFNSGNYNIVIAGFVRYDVRNIAKIDDITPFEEPEEPEEITAPGEDVPEQPE